MSGLIGLPHSPGRWVHHFIRTHAPTNWGYSPVGGIVLAPDHIGVALARPVDVALFHLFQVAGEAVMQVQALDPVVGRLLLLTALLRGGVGVVAVELVGRDALVLHLLPQALERRLDLNR